MQGFGSYDYGRNNPFENRLNEEGLYKHVFVAENSWKNKQINLVFDGVMTDCEVKLNGRSVGETHQGAFYQFKYPIDKLVKFGSSNLLEIHVKKHSSNSSVNEAERSADFWVFGGIYRPVSLEINPKEHIKRVAIDAKGNGQFTADVYLSSSHPEGSVKVEIFGPDGKIKAEFSNSFNTNEGKVRLIGIMPNPNTWSPEFPTLYFVKFSLLNNKNVVVHQTEEKIGF